MSEVFDENSARAKIDSLLEQKWPFEKYNAGNVIISRGTVAICFWEIARWQFEKDKALIADLKSQLEAKGSVIRTLAEIAVSLESCFDRIADEQRFAYGTKMSFGEIRQYLGSRGFEALQAKEGEG